MSRVPIFLSLEAGNSYGLCVQKPSACAGCSVSIDSCGSTQPGILEILGCEILMFASSSGPLLHDLALA